MKNWQPVPHFGVKVLATYLLGYLATNLTVFAITWQANLSANTANNLMKLSCALTLLALSRWWLHLPLFKRPQHVSKAALIVLMIISLNLVTPNLHWGCLRPHSLTVYASDYLKKPPVVARFYFGYGRKHQVVVRLTGGLPSQVALDLACYI